MPNTQLKVHPRASTAMDGLSAADRQNLLQAVEGLEGLPPAAWPPDRVTRLPDAEPIYLLRVSPDLRAIIRSSGAEVEVLDLVRPETLRWFRDARQNGGLPG
jgi:hypothetical protein